MVLKDCEKRTEALLQFIEESPSVFHAVESIKTRLLSAGYTELSEACDWERSSGGRYFVTRNDSSIAAFAIPEDNKQEEEKNSLGGVKGFHIAAAHSDSPSFKIKENPEMKTDGQYVRLNTEKYGGMIMSTWLDRTLSVAGRVVCRQDGKLVSRLVNVDRVRDGFLHAVEVVVETCACQQEEGGGDAAQFELAGKDGLEGILDHFDGHFGGFGEELAVIF